MSDQQDSWKKKLEELQKQYENEFKEDHNIGESHRLANIKVAKMWFEVNSVSEILEYLVEQVNLISPETKEPGELRRRLLTNAETGLDYYELDEGVRIDRSYNERQWKFFFTFKDGEYSLGFGNILYVAPFMGKTVKIDNFHWEFIRMRLGPGNEEGFSYFEIEVDKFWIKEFYNLAIENIIKDELAEFIYTVLIGHGTSTREQRRNKN